MEKRSLKQVRFFQNCAFIKLRNIFILKNGKTIVKTGSFLDRFWFDFLI